MAKAFVFLLSTVMDTNAIVTQGTQVEAVRSVWCAAFQERVVMGFATTQGMQNLTASVLLVRMELAVN